MEKTRTFEEGVEFKASIPEEYAEILTPEAVSFVAKLNREFGGRVEEILEKRKRISRSRSTRASCRTSCPRRGIREGDWTVAPVPQDLLDRRVEITGPVDRKMIINALNSGANVHGGLRGLELRRPGTTCVDGQLNLRDAVRRTIRFDDPETGKHYALDEKIAAVCRAPARLAPAREARAGRRQAGPAALFDFGLFFFHNAQRRSSTRGTGPYFYLPKMESHLEARLWNDVFVCAQERARASRGAPSRRRCSSRRCPRRSRWTRSSTSCASTRRASTAGAGTTSSASSRRSATDPGCVLPDRAQVTMDQPFLRAYTQLLIQTCHRRGVHAMGGMAAQIPIKDDPEAERGGAARRCARTSCARSTDGHDGTWVAHPGLVPSRARSSTRTCRRRTSSTSQREDVDVDRGRPAPRPEGTRTEAGLRHNIRVGVQYLEAWLRGHGCVPLYNLMEDAATAEISRAQVWQWIRHARHARRRQT